MKPAIFVLGEVFVAGLLAGLLILALLYQPTWVWTTAPLIMIAGFVGIVLIAKSNPRRARLLALLCPLSYTAYLAALGLSTQAPSAAFFLTVAGYYAGGALLLGAHFWLNAKAR